MTNQWPQTAANLIPVRTDQLAQPFLATEASWVMPLISTFVAAKTLDASQSHDDYMRMQFCNRKCYARKHIAGVSLIDATDAADTVYNSACSSERPQRHSGSYKCFDHRAILTFDGRSTH